MTCEEFQRGTSLPPMEATNAETRDAARHLRGCDACQRWFEDLKRLVDEERKRGVE